MNLPRFSIQNPLFVNCLTLFLLLAGGLTLFTIQREAFPPISFDMVTVRTNYPGATPSVVEKFVTIKIEDELKSVDNIDEMTSVSTENMSMIVLQLDPDAKDQRKIENDIQRAVDRVKDLPGDLPENPVVTKLEARNTPVITVSLSGAKYSDIHKYAKTLEDQLLNIKEVNSIRRMGYFDPEIWVDVDPNKAKAFHIALSDVIHVLRQSNVNLSAGTLDTPGGEVIMRINDEFDDLEDVRRVIIQSNDQGYPVRVGDVAAVHHAFEDNDEIFKTDGRESINLMVIKRETGDILRLVDEIKKEVARFKKTAPGDIDVHLVDDFSYFVKRRLRVLVNNGTVGAILVLILLFLLLTPQIAATAALDIPVTFLATIALMYALGMTINLMSMFGLIMVIGMLVDDSVIMAENIHRHIEKGGEIHAAAIRGAEEVMRPVTTAVLTSIFAYLPLMFMSGIIGKYVRAIPLVVCMALFVSWLTTLISIPTHAAEFTRIARKWGVARRKEGHWFDAIRDGYIALMKKAIDRRYLVMVLITAVFAASICLLVFKMKFVLFTADGIDEFTIRAKSKIGSSVHETYAKMEPVERIVATLPKSEMQNFVTQAGSHKDRERDVNSDRGSHLAQINVYLTPTADRARDAREIILEMENKIKDVTGFEELYVEKVRPGPPVGKAVDAKIRGDDFETIRKVVEKYKHYLTGLEGVENIQDDFSIGKNEIDVRIDREKAARAFLTYEEIAREIRHTFEGGIATTIQKSEEEIDIRVKYPEDSTQSLDSFRQILIPNRRGNLIPLKEIAAFGTHPGLAAIKRFDRKRMVTVTADVNETKATSILVNRKLMENFKDIQSEYPEISVVYKGEDARTRESLLSLLRSCFLALVLIYFIITIQFKSLIQPLVVMLTIPLAFVGVIWAFFLHGKALVFLSLMGMIGLAGVVVNDSIVLIDFMNKLRLRGVERRASILEACRHRFRAVVLASLTTVCGTLPLAYGLGGDDPFLKPMALAFSWGLAFSISITLIVIPCAYSVVDDIAVKVMRRPTVKTEPI